MKNQLLQKLMQKALLLGITLFSSVQFAQAQYCTMSYPSGCGSWGTSQVTIGAYTHSPTCGTGAYQNYTATQNIPLTAGLATACSITTIGWTCVGIAVDFNNNQDFTDVGEVLATPAYNASGGTVANLFSITVPASVQPGSYRMRIWNRGGNSGGANNGVLPCGTYGYGRYLDYTAVITNPATCVPPSNLSVTGITTSAANVSFSAPTLGNPATNYIYELRVDGTAAASGATGLVQNGTQAATTVNFTTLSAATDYVFYIKTICSVADSSVWVSKAFTTTFDTLTPVSLGQLNSDVIANGIGTALSSTTNDVDGASYALVAADYQTTSASAMPTANLPLSRIILNGLKKYRLADYSLNNSLRQPLTTTTGAVRFLAPKRANKVYIMGISGSGVSAFNAIVYFNDATTQTKAMNFPDWYAATGNIVVSGVGRINRTNNNFEAPGPKLYDSAISITTENRNKQIDSIVIQRTGTTTGVSNILAVSIVPNINQPCRLPGMPTIANLNCFGGTVTWQGNSINTQYEISYGAVGTLADLGTIVSVTGSTGANTFQFVNGSAFTTLQIYVRSKCSTTSYSDWVGPLEFTLPALLITPTFTLPSAVCLNAPPPSLPTTSNNGIIGTWSPATISNTNNDTYTFTPSAVNPCANVVSIAMTVSGYIVPAFPAIAPFCEGTTPSTLPTTSTNGFTGTWTPATVNNTISGTYHFTPAAGSSACVDTTSMNVVVKPIPRVTENISICSEELPYTWHNIVIAAGGTSAATFTSNAANGCDSITTLDLNVVVNTTPSVTVTANPSTNVTIGQSVTFTATLVDAIGSNPTIQWYKSGQQILGGTGTTWTAVAGQDFLNGENIWAVAEGFNSCAAVQSASSNQIEMAVSLGVFNGKLPLGFKLYPNPTNQFLNIEGLKQGTNIKIVDALGRILINKDVLNNASQTVDLSKLNAGTYLVLFQDAQGARWMQRVNKL